jgi:hypothetical protein
MDDPRNHDSPRTLSLRVEGRDAPLSFVARCLIVAGYTARDRAAAQHHIDELAEIGVAPPRRVPTFYVLPPDALTTDGAIEVDGPGTTGEAEPVLFCAGATWYLGVGSDHTDRDLETVDVGLSKRACAKVVSSSVLEFSEIESDWDALRLRSWTGEERRPYQDGSMASLMTGRSILEELADRVDVDHEGLVVFCGTVPLSDGGFRPAGRFGAELAGPGGEALLRCSYDVITKERV